VDKPSRTASFAITLPHPMVRQAGCSIFLPTLASDVSVGDSASALISLGL